MFPERLMQKSAAELSGTMLSMQDGGLSEKMFELCSGFMLKADGIAIRLQWLQRVERLSEEKVFLYVLFCDAGI